MTVQRVDGATLARIKVMLCQEETRYTTKSYLFINRQVSGPSFEIDSKCREAMVQWCYQCCDFCSFSYESVEFTVSFLDRFMMTEEGLECLKSDFLFQLATMACLYIAVKMHEPEIMSSKIVAKLSHGLYTVQQVEQMELKIMQALNWRLNPPTASAFVREFLELMKLPKLQKDSMLELCKLQIVLAMSDCTMVPVKASEIAFGTFLNALESLGLEKFIVSATIYTLLDDNYGALRENVRFRLYKALADAIPKSMAKRNCLNYSKSSIRVSRSILQRSSPRSIVR